MRSIRWGFIITEMWTTLPIVWPNNIGDINLLNQRLILNSFMPIDVLILYGIRLGGRWNTPAKATHYRTIPKVNKKGRLRHHLLYPYADSMEYSSSFFWLCNVGDRVRRLSPDWWVHYAYIWAGMCRENMLRRIWIQMAYVSFTCKGFIFCSRIMWNADSW